MLSDSIDQFTSLKNIMDLTKDRQYINVYDFNSVATVISYDKLRACTSIAARECKHCIVR